MHPAACVCVRAVDYAEFKTYENLFSRYFGQLCENLHKRKFPAIVHCIHRLSIRVALCYLQSDWSLLKSRASTKIWAWPVSPFLL